MFEQMPDDNQLWKIMEESRKVLAGGELADRPSLVHYILRTYNDLDPIDQEGYADAAEIFLTAFMEEKMAVEDLVEEEASSQISSKAHSLKGIISIFGADPLVRLLQKIEKLASEEDSFAVEHAFHEFWDDYDALAKILKQYVSSNS